MIEKPIFKSIKTRICFKETINKTIKKSAALSSLFHSLPLYYILKRQRNDFPFQNIIDKLKSLYKLKTRKPPPIPNPEWSFYQNRDGVSIMQQEEKERESGKSFE